MQRGRLPKKYRSQEKKVADRKFISKERKMLSRKVISIIEGLPCESWVQTSVMKRFGADDDRLQLRFSLDIKEWQKRARTRFL